MKTLAACTQEHIWTHKQLPYTHRMHKHNSRQTWHIWQIQRSHNHKTHAQQWGAGRKETYRRNRKNWAAGSHERYEETNFRQTWKGLGTNQQHADMKHMKASTAGRQIKYETIKSSQTGEVWKLSTADRQETYGTVTSCKTGTNTKSMHTGKAKENQIADRQDTYEKTSSMNKGNRWTD